MVARSGPLGDVACHVCEPERRVAAWRERPGRGRRGDSVPLLLFGGPPGAPRSKVGNASLSPVFGGVGSARVPIVAPGPALPDWPMGRVLPFGLGRQSPASPHGIGGGVGMRYVNDRVMHPVGDRVSRSGGAPPAGTNPFFPIVGGID